MERLTLIRPVLIKVKVTENYKKSAVSELQEAVRRTEVDLQRLDYQEKHLITDLEKKNPSGIPAAKQHIQKERQRVEENRNKMLQRLKEIDELVLDTEIVYGKMESPVDISVGDQWRQVLSVEVVLQDGIITEIR